MIKNFVAVFVREIFFLASSGSDYIGNTTKHQNLELLRCLQDSLYYLLLYGDGDSVNLAGKGAKLTKLVLRLVRRYIFVYDLDTKRRSATECLKKAKSFDSMKVSKCLCKTRVWSC